MNALIDWTNFPPDVIEILLRDFNGDRKTARLIRVGLKLLAGKLRL